MKVILILMISLSSVAQAKECGLPFKNENASLMGLFKNSNSKIEVPDGQCKRVKQEFLQENSFTCDKAHEAMVAADQKLAKKYDCYQPAHALSNRVENGVYVSSVYAICYVCNGTKAK